MYMYIHINICIYVYVYIATYIVCLNPPLDLGTAAPWRNMSVSDAVKCDPRT